MTDLRGVETHGVSNMLRAYVRDYRAGKLDPRPGWTIEREAPGTAVIDAGKRLGIIVGPKAMRLAIEKARKVGVGIVTVHNSGHFGAIGHFAMQAAEADMVGACFTAAGLHVVPTFGAKPLLGTNPIALAAPARREAPMLFDAATSAIAGNKIRLAMRIGSPLLAGWVTDKEGTPIMEEKPLFDREDVYQAPLGGTREQGSHKGYGFALMAEVLSTMLAGALPTMLAPGQRVQEPVRGVQHRGLHRPRALQGHDGRDAPHPAHRRARAGPGARALPGAVRGRGARAPPRPRHPAPQGSDRVVRRVHARDGAAAPGYRSRVFFMTAMPCSIIAWM